MMESCQSGLGKDIIINAGLSMVMKGACRLAYKGRLIVKRESPN